MRLRTKGPWTILAAAFAFVVLLTGACSSGAPPPQENDPAPAPTREGSSDVADASGPPLGDCYGGVFAIEPMHCYMLEQAEAEGVFDIEAIFENKKDGLTIYVSQDEFSDETGTFITQKATEFFGSWPDLIPSRTYSRASANTPAGAIRISAQKCGSMVTTITSTSSCIENMDTCNSTRGE